MNAAASYSIGSLAAAAGVSRRTVRFYVQRALLPPPEGLGRGAHYTGDHLACLLQIKGWQEQGVPLDEIHARLVPVLTSVDDGAACPAMGRGRHRRRRQAQSPFVAGSTAAASPSGDRQLKRTLGLVASG